MKRVKEFYNIIQYVLSKELDWYEGYVTNVDPEYRKGFIAGINAMKILIASVYRKIYIDWNKMNKEGGI